MSDTSQGEGWWLANNGKWYPPQEVSAAHTTDGAFAHHPVPSNPVLSTPPGYVLVIGDIGVTQDQIVTPNGTGPLAGSQWIFTDRTSVQETIPAWAIVMAIIFALACLLGLLFLLVKEKKITGYAEVSVRTGTVSHMTQLPVISGMDIQRYRQMVSQAQSLAAAAGNY